MRLELTENAKKFIETLTEEALTKVTFTEDAMESADESISNKLMEYAKERLRKVGEEVRLTTERLKEEHPEYFKNN